MNCGKASFLSHRHILLQPQILGALVKAFPKPLAAKEEAKAIADLRSGDRQARELLIQHNLRLVAHVVKKYGFPEKDLEDYISIGIIGLIKAIDTFDDSKGIRITTYASRCIDNEILMAIRGSKKQSREMYLSDSVNTDREGREIHLLDIITEPQEDFCDRFVIEDDIRTLREAMSKLLDTRELEILRMRYGFTCGKELTQREVADRFQISRSYVSRIEKKAITKLRKALMERNL